MKFKFLILELSSIILFLICFFLLLLFCITNFQPLILCYFIFSVIVFMLIRNSKSNFRAKLYNIYLSGDETEIAKINKWILDYTVSGHLISLQYEYTFCKKQHPTFEQFDVMNTNTLPPNILINFNAIKQKLDAENFCIGKEINYSTDKIKLETFLIDVVNKRFAIVDGLNLDIFPFSELKNCELYQSSNDIQTSARPSTYKTDIHTSVVINLKNNIQKPNITINFLNLHKSLFPNAAYDIKGALDYILEQNNTIQS